MVMPSTCSTVIAGSSRSLSWVPGPPPRTSTEVTAGVSKTIAVVPDPRRGSWAWPTRTPSTSVTRLRMGGFLRGPTETMSCSRSIQEVPLRPNPERRFPAARPPITSRRSFEGGLALEPGPGASSAVASDVTLAAALAAGALSFLSPCVLPLVPPYLVYLAGASLERLEDAEPEISVRRDAVVAAGLFVLGFSTVFVLLGAGASVVGGLLRAYANELAILAGLAIIAMGLHFLGLTRISWLMREKRAEIHKPVGLWGAYAMGLAFAFGWTPCIGPILAAILAVAASEATLARGAGLLAVYSLGLGLPFMAAALAVEPFAAFVARFRGHLVHVERAMGGLLVLTGIAFL